LSRANDGVALPVPEACAFFYDVGTLFDADAVRNAGSASALALPAFASLWSGLGEVFNEAVQAFVCVE
jgi:hypothetical protein